jgi:hypothetical protein
MPLPMLPAPTTAISSGGTIERTVIATALSCGLGQP